MVNIIKSILFYRDNHRVYFSEVKWSKAVIDVFDFKHPLN